MLGFAYIFLAWLAATAVPAFLGLLLVAGMSRVVRGKSLTAFALGVFMWFFVDTMGGSAYLDVNAGFAGGLGQVAMLALFAIGLLSFLSVSGDLFSQELSAGELGLAIPMIVALAVGLHGLGEGAAYGATAYSTPSTSLLDAFGGLAASVAYALHKAIEPAMIGACYAVYTRYSAKRAAEYLRDAAVLTALFVIPSLIGVVTGYYVASDATYFFALGAGASIYVALRLARPLFQSPGASTRRESVETGLLILFGFLCIYLAALLHS